MVEFRADKTTRNNDDFKVMVIGVLLAILLMVGTPTVETLWDRFISDRPYISATVEIVPPIHEGVEPTILYDADPNQSVDGNWIASIVGADNEQFATRTGVGHYVVKQDDPKIWTWFAFFDNEKGLNSPGYPDVPFKVCVRYVVNARDSGSNDEGPDYCSKIYDPRG